jgi:DNA-binding transcriptional LysR family regulator
MVKSLDWDLLRSFLAVARAGKLTVAARRLGVDHSTLSRRLAALEAALGAKLFERTLTGYALTPQGEALLAQTETMESAVLGIQSDIGQSGSQVSGTVRIGAPDGFGTAFLAPRIGALLAAQPGLRVELVAVPRSFSLSRREADIVVSLSRPTHGRLHTRKLTDYALGLYAVPALAARVMRLEDIAVLPFISYIEDLLYAPELDYVPLVSPRLEPRLRSANLMAQYQAALAGTGLCILPCFLAAGDARLVRLLPDEVALTRTFWMTVQSDMRELARIRVTGDFIAQAVAQETGLFLPPAE